MSDRLDAVWRWALRYAYRLQLAWWFVRRPEISGAYVAVWYEGQVLVIQNSYRRRLSFPAGGLKRRETPVEAAVRELGEEVGIAVGTEDLLYHGEILSSSGYAVDHAHFFELFCDTAPTVRVDRREVVWAEFVAPDEALARGVVGAVRTYLEGR